MKTTVFNCSIPSEQLLLVHLLDVQPLTFLLVTKRGELYLYNTAKKQLDLFACWEEIPAMQDLTCYSFEQYFCLVENTAVNGRVYHLKDPDYVKLLARGDYQVEHCSYPISFFKKEHNTYLIHGQDWNQINISCLNSDELLTVRKEDKEDEYVDYFHSSLKIAPDARHFCSNGWVWNPWDMITIYNIEQFYTSFEQAAMRLEEVPTSGYNWDRPLCWINNSLLAVGANMTIEQIDEGEKVANQAQILIYDIHSQEITRQLPFNGFFINNMGDIYGDLFFDRVSNYFICYNFDKGVSMMDRFGNHEKQLDDSSHLSFCPIHRVFYGLNHEENQLDIIPLEL